MRTASARCVVLALALAFAAGCEKEPPPPPPPPSVKVTTVVQKDVPVYLELIGQTRGSTEIEVRARVEGIVESVDFVEGSPVKKGDLLYTLDPRPLQADLAEARGQLAQREAELARARQDVARYEPLVAKNAISRQEYETAVAARDAASAGVDAGRAAVEAARVDLSFTRIEAPADGVVGKTEVYAGTLVGRGQSTLLTRISQLETVHVRFDVNEKDYLALVRRKVDQGGGRGDIPFELILADGSTHPHPGTLVFVDRAVNPETGTIMVEAAFPNPEGILRPGQYGRVRATIDTKKGALLVPQRAVSELPGSFNVAVVGAGDVVEIRPVKTAERVGSEWVIDSGLQPGERVVVEGLQKVGPGVKVAPVDAGSEAAAGGTQ